MKEKETNNQSQIRPPNWVYDPITPEEAVLEWFKKQSKEKIKIITKPIPPPTGVWGK